MGNCTSSPELRAGMVAAAAATSPELVEAVAAAATDAVGAKGLGPKSRTASADLQMALLEKVNSLQQQLAMVNASPLLGLPEAAELLAEELEADLVGIWVSTTDDPDTTVLMAAYGKGADILQQRPVVRRRPGSGGCVVGAACAFAVAEASQPGAAIEPAELWEGNPQLRSFVQVPIGNPSAPYGTLLVAKADASAFEGPWWQLQLQLAAAGLLPHARQGQVERMARLLKRLDAIEDPCALVGALLQSASDFLLRSCTLRASARLALMQPRQGADALLFETPCPLAGASSSSGPRSTADPSSAASDEEEGVVASLLKVPNTLLAAAVAQRQARFVADVSHYCRSCPRPVRDIFTRHSRLVSAVIVVPLINNEESPLGALYFALDAPCEFINIQDTLLGFIHGVTPLLHQKLSGKAEALASAVQAAQRRNSSIALTGDTSDAALVLSNSWASEGAGLSHSGRLPMISSSQRLNTEAMVQLLQSDLQTKTRRTRSESGGRGAEVAVGECLGQGGCGAVFRGTWHRVPVAVKVMPARNDEREAMQDAVEMAVLSSVQHPNIVTVYSCLTDMVEDCEGAAGRSMSGDLRTYYRHLHPEEDPDGELPTYNIIVMEPCDRGSLRTAIAQGMLHQTMPNGAIGVRLAAAVEVLLDVAYALQYLHSMQLVHGDLRAENVLLKTDRARPLGATPKLADFGLTRILNDAQQLSGAAPARAAAHIAPEALTAGGQVTTAVDSYAFGILMWEAYTSKRAFSSVPPLELADRVTRGGLRPKFPSSAPPAFVSLAQACWAAEPAARPSFGEVAAALEEVAAQLARGSA